MKWIEAICGAVETWQAVTAVLAVATGAVSWLSVTFYKVYGLTKSADTLKQAVERMERLLGAELKYNGGRSMKDVLDALQSSFGKMEAWNTALLNQSSVAAWRADSRGDIDWVNAAFTHHTGVGLENLKGSLWLDLVCEDHRDRVEQQWRKCVDRSAPFTATFLVAPGDPNSDNVLMQAQPFFAPQKQGGSLLGFAGALQIVGRE